MGQDNIGESHVDKPFSIDPKLQDVRPSTPHFAITNQFWSISIVRSSSAGQELVPRATLT